MEQKAPRRAIDDQKHGCGDENGTLIKAVWDRQAVTRLRIKGQILTLPPIGYITLDRLFDFLKFFVHKMRTMITRLPAFHQDYIK